jgi:hypothetical protein
MKFAWHNTGKDKVYQKDIWRSGVINPLILTLALDVRQRLGLRPAPFTPGKIASIFH